MSRIGKNPILIPKNVEITLDNEKIFAKGILGSGQVRFTSEVFVISKNNYIVVKPANSSKRARALWGTTQAIISNLMIGITKGFTKKIIISGIGYRANIEKEKIILQLGYSHDIEVDIPHELQVIAENPTTIKIFGLDKFLVGQFAARLRQYRSPEPYKGKGIRYEGEYIVRKEGKKK